MGYGGMSHANIVLSPGHSGEVGRTPVDVFSSIFTVFLILGTLVGIVVIGYALYNAYVYRENGEKADEAADSKKVVRPTLGELPKGSGGGKKLFVSFGISAVIVLSLIVWTYSALLFVEDTPQGDESLEIDVIGGQFSWTFEYPNGYSEVDTLRVPRGATVKLNVTSRDVMHNIGIPEFRTKTDAIPGQTTTAWFTPYRTGTFEAVCYELCGAGHSQMRSDVIVMDPDDYQEWYASTNGTASNTTSASTAGGEA
jgi:cytochrome c oxidase subunit 2